MRAILLMRRAENAQKKTAAAVFVQSLGINAAYGCTA
jgi:hypothetical protein